MCRGDVGDAADMSGDDMSYNGDVGNANDDAPHVSPVWLTEAQRNLFVEEFDVEDPDVAAALRQLLERETPIEDVVPAPEGSPLRHGERRAPVKRSPNDCVGRRMQSALRERMRRANKSRVGITACAEFLDITSHLASSDRTNILHWVHRHCGEKLRSCLPKCKFVLGSLYSIPILDSDIQFQYRIWKSDVGVHVPPFTVLGALWLLLSCVVHSHAEIWVSPQI